jgi:hypothetical protein
VEGRIHTLSADTLDFLKLSHLRGCLDVLESNVLVLAEVDDTAEIEVEALCCSVGL